MEYVIYHPFGGVINHECKRGLFEYVPVAKVPANSLEEAFLAGQNDLNPVYALLGHRSTCVGDIIAPSSIYLKGNSCPREFHMVMNHGFTEVPFSVVTFIDWGNHM